MQENNFKTSISLEDVFSLFSNKNQEFKSMELNALLKLYAKMQEPLVKIGRASCRERVLLIV